MYINIKFLKWADSEIEINRNINTKLRELLLVIKGYTKNIIIFILINFGKCWFFGVGNKCSGNVVKCSSPSKVSIKM